MSTDKRAYVRRQGRSRRAPRDAMSAEDIGAELRARCERWKADAIALADRLHATIQEMVGEDGYSYCPEEVEVLAAHDRLVAEEP